MGPAVTGGVSATLGAAALCAWVAGVGCRAPDPAQHAARATTIEVRELTPAPGALALPLRDGSVRFAVIGDSGRGDDAQHEVARQMAAWRARFAFDFVVMLGDNIYDPHGPDDYVQKFEAPYKALLDGGVTFHAAIGNHDDPGQIHYAGFHMGGKRYYTFRRAERRVGGLIGAGVRFFVLDSRSFDPDQLDWLRREATQSRTEWKIALFHHPLYTSGRYSRAADSLRVAVEPILVAADVDVVLSGHEHFYERVKAQRGIAYFTSGGAGSLRRGDIRQTPLTARGFDTDYHFMLMEIAGDELFFQAISRTGQTIDAGVITRKTGRVPSA